MNKIVVLFFFLLFSSVSAQQDTVVNKLSVSPVIELTDTNRAIIEALEQFLNTKNANPQFNDYWLKSDFDTFITPYKDILHVEEGRYGANFYKPSLMELVSSSTANKKIAKIAYIGHDTTTNSNFIRLIYNIVVEIESNEIKFSSYTTYSTNTWQVLPFSGINYIISKDKKPNYLEINRQIDEIQYLKDFYNFNLGAITYYSCINPMELFHIKGFDYNSAMYLSNNGGLAENGNIVFSGNNSEYYTHEVSHLFTRTLFPALPILIDEGLATYFGGSGLYDYTWHKAKLRQYVRENELDYLQFIHSPYQRFYIEDETPVPYLIGALLCEYGLRNIGKDAFLRTLKQSKSTDTIWQLVSKWGITKDNMNDKINMLLL